MNPVAQVAHQIQGRARIRVPSKRGDTEYFAFAHESLRACPSIEDIRVNPFSGSIVINHVDSSLDALIRFAQEKQLFTLEETEDRPEVLLENASSGLEYFDTGIKNLSGGVLDLRSVLFILLMGLAIRQIVIGNTMGPASTLLWQALGLVVTNKIGD